MLLNEKIIRNLISVFNKLDQKVLQGMGADYYQKSFSYDSGDYLFIIKVYNSKYYEVIHKPSSRCVFFIEEISDHEMFHHELTYTIGKNNNNEVILDYWLLDGEIVQRSTYNFKDDYKSTYANFFISEEEIFQMSTVDEIDYELVQKFHAIVNEMCPVNTRVVLYDSIIRHDLEGKFEIKGLDDENV